MRPHNRLRQGITPLGLEEVETHLVALGLQLAIASVVIISGGYLAIKAMYMLDVLN